MKQRDSLLGTFEQLVLLAVLRAGDQAYPPKLIEVVEAATGRAPSRGAVYVTLDRLETKGLMSSSLVEPTPDRGGRPRRSLTVTPAGVTALREARRSLVSMWSTLDELQEE